MRFLPVVVVLGLGLVSTAALAQPPSATQPLPPLPQEPLVESYRQATISVDIVAGVATVVAFADPRNVGPLAAGMYAFGAPVMHLLHHRPSRAIGSLALRAIPFGIGFLILDGGHKGYEILLPLIAGVFGSALAVSIIDSAVLAKGDEPPPPARSWTPAVAPTRSGFTLGLRGSF
jgi:hypothetical protein